ncbi:MAG: exodeoxyribonuclease VII small subunit, partial [Alkalispirochaeta sp.]
MQDFEERLKRLEEIGERLRSGELSIDDATKLFEEGVGLSRKLEEELQQMERRIEMLT